MPVPKEDVAARRDKRRAQHKLQRRDRQLLPAVQEPQAAASCLPQVRHVQGPRGHPARGRGQEEVAGGRAAPQRGAGVNSLYIAATEGGGGKTTLAVGLCLALRGRGLDAGYFKPVGVAEQGHSTTTPSSPPTCSILPSLADLCPVLLHDDALRAAGGGVGTTPWSACAAFARCAAAPRCGHLRGPGRDLAGPLPAPQRRRRGRSPGPARAAGGQVRRHPPARRCLLHPRRAQASACSGVVFTMVPETRMEVVEHHYTPFLAENGITLLRRPALRLTAPGRAASRHRGRPQRPLRGRRGAGRTRWPRATSSAP